MIEAANTNVYSLEVSMYGYKPDIKSDKILAYTEENCGEGILKTFFLFNFCQISYKEEAYAGHCGTIIRYPDISRAVTFLVRRSD